MLDVIFVILHYNTIDETINCVKSIKELKDNKKIKIIIVDNKSPNNTGIELEEMYKDDELVDVLLNDNNSGFSRGNNYGYTYMKEKYDTKFAIFCNNDIIFNDREIIEKIKNIYKKEKFYVLGPDVYNPRCDIHQSPIPIVNSKLWRVNITIFLNKLALTFFGFYWFLVTHLSRNNKNKTNEENKIQEVKLERKNNVPMMGACLIFSNDFVKEREKVFEPETFMYYEEYMLHNWCVKNNKNTIFEPDITVYHNDGMATNSIKDTEKNKCRFRMEKILESAKIYRKRLKGKI
ncbi:MAG: glycosyltransferase family 2 protein [Clostridia bacterium]|nr:glycosyltransferase family 2 protein [Clostridia bacterium]